MITLNDYLTSSGKYPERAKSAELTPERLKNARRLIDAIIALFKDVGIQSYEISSGFRPSAVNKQIANAAKASLHCECLAVDFADLNDQTFGKKIAARPDLLRKHGLFLEDLGSTKTWFHLDLGKRADRPSRIFKP